MILQQYKIPNSHVDQYRHPCSIPEICGFAKGLMICASCFILNSHSKWHRFNELIYSAWNQLISSSRFVIYYVVEEFEEHLIVPSSEDEQCTISTPLTQKYDGVQFWWLIVLIGEWDVAIFRWLFSHRIASFGIKLSFLFTLHNVDSHPKELQTVTVRIKMH